MDRILALPVPLDLFFVDDDSPDGTGRLLDDLSALTPQLRVIHRSGKLGLETAYREAYSALLKEDYAYFLQMDADLSHRPEDIVRHAPCCGVSRPCDWKQVLCGGWFAELAPCSSYA